jgi:hypothetical protein
MEDRPLPVEVFTYASYIDPKTRHNVEEKELTSLAHFFIEA